ncbi:MAG: [FeFe] hydrogenase H-cluster radical SAM maturase HydE [Syntrophomonadaceae bacterium]|nr:[FeFe] hydrogenase H-cluster radical SAM maturase HydE [Syntrophomonadaceae bacterium]
MTAELFAKISREETLTRDELVALLSLSQPEDLEQLFQLADRIRERYVGNDVHLRGLIEFSNICRKNCRYCGIRSGNSRVGRYRMSIDEIIITAKLVEALGYKTVVLQSGEDPYYSAEMLADLIKRIKRDTRLAITLSIGERSRQEYQQFFDAGADRFLLRFETSNPALYKNLHPDSDYERRMQILAWFKEIGYQVGSGIMIGLPDQTLEDLALDILKFKELDLDMIGVGPYISHPDTPLAGSANGTAEMTLKVIALTRIVTRNTHIPATTALATLRPADGREKALQAGANVVMPNVTPLKYRELYELYPEKICVNEAAEQCHNCIRQRIFRVGRSISTDFGHSLKRTYPGG